MQRETTDILIAGGGIAGLTAAAAFGAAGFSVICIDPARPVTDASSPDADLRTTAVLQPARDLLIGAGLWGRLSAHATPLAVMRIVDAGGKTLVTRDFVAADIAPKGIGDPFGWNLPNWLLRRALLARLAELPRVSFRPGTGFAGLLARDRAALVTLTDGTRVSARLLIGADGRTSPVRDAAGIGVRTLHYGQKALSFAVTHAAPHDNVSTEVHRSGGPFTLVPLPDLNGVPCSSVVWMDHGAEVVRLAALPPDAFAAAATERAADLYGPLTLASRRQIWPIISQIADRMAAGRVALIAEAAHVLPPIGAQGLNMSLADLACLLTLAAASPDTLGDAPMLDTYTRQRHPAAMLRVAGIAGLNLAAMAGLPLLQSLRGLGLRALHDIAPLRREVMKLGLGAPTPGR